MQQCPSCSYELTMQEQVDNPDSCPKCGIYFEKFLAKQAALKEAALSEGGRTGGLAGAKAGMRQARAKRTEQEKKLADLRSNPTYVSVVDFKVPFWSLVFFLVKLVIAAIPAAIIVALIFSVPGVLINAFSEYSRLTDNSRAANAEAESRAERAESCKTVEQYAEIVMTARQDGAGISDLISGDLSERTRQIVYQAFDRPRFDVPSLREREINEFKNKYYLECARGY